MELNATIKLHELHSPGYNHHGYPLSVRCDWVISQPDGLDIQIDIVDLKMEESEDCKFDELIILDSETCEHVSCSPLLFLFLLPFSVYTL